MSLDLDKKLLAIIADDGSLFGKSLEQVDQDFFKGPYRKIHHLLTQYYSKHHRLPSFDLIEQQIYKNKAKIFTDENVDKFLLDLRKEATLTDSKDFEFLIEEARKRRGYEIIQDSLPEAAKLAKNQDIDKAAELLVFTGNSLRATLNEKKLERTSNHDHAEKIKEKYKKAKNDPEVSWGYRSGFSKLDKATYGIAPGEMFIIGARPGNGKSVFLLSVAKNMFMQGINVLYVSVEMPTDQMWDRASACYTGFEINDIKEGTLDPTDEDQFFKKMDEFKNNKTRFEILDAPGVTAPTIASEIEQMIDEHKPQVVFIDYLGIVRPSEKGLQDNLAQAAVVEELRMLARQKKVGMWTAVQLNRDPNKGKAKSKGLERVARSDVIGATADCVIQIEEFDIEEEMTKLSDRVTIAVIKNRKGPFPFPFDVRKNFPCAQFLDWDLGWGGDLGANTSIAEDE